MTGVRLFPAALAAALAVALAVPAAAQEPAPAHPTQPTGTIGPPVPMERGPAIPQPRSDSDTPPPEQIVTGLSQDEVDITASFTGSDILIYGAIRRNAPVDDPTSPGIIVTLEGPSQSVTVRRMGRVGPIWMNTATLRVGAAPDFYAVSSSAPLDQLLDPDEDVRHRISPALAIRALGTVDVEDATAFTEAMLRIRTESGRYRVDEGSVQLVDETLFRADVVLPSNLIEGDYRARIFLVRGGKVVDRNTVPIRVEKVGIERWLYRLSIRHSFWYGLMSLGIAIAAGALASAAFRVLRRG
ncbi:TIGR02186 family protein [Paracoccus sp. SJTW-4]|uniref:TIGR02186 family protein n=1 Tax=Paracoccus sp. SJTW-4 TaxID=3078428 RepID=UPI0039E77A77